MFVLISSLHVALAVFLFYAINWVGRHASGYGYLSLSLFVKTDEAPAFNFVLKAFAPAVFVILVATASYSFHFDNIVSRIWLVAVYYYAFRLLYNLVLGRALLLNWLSLSVQGVAGISASYLAYRYLIVPRHPLFPELDKIGNQLWVIVALFLYATFNSVRTSGAASARRKNSYLRSRYKTLSGQYGGLITNQFPSRYMELVAYAILIHETFNRPWIAQKVERAVFPWGSHTIGPMQVKSDSPLSDLESVHKGVELLKNHFEATKLELQGARASRYEIIGKALAKYNRDENYVREVQDLLYVLWAQAAPEYRSEFERAYVAGPVA